MKYYNKSNINILVEKAPATPRMCVTFYFKVTKKEKYYGVNSLLARLLLQGTKTKTGAQLAQEFEQECIDISTKAKQDYIKISLVFLNQDFNHAMELLNDLIANSTFNEFEKEVYKIKGEIVSDLDNPKIKLTDAFIKNLYDKHPYSSTLTKVLDDIDKIEKEDIIEAHAQMLNSPKNIVVVGDWEDENKILEYFENNFPYMKSSDTKDEIQDIFKLEKNEDEIVWINKDDASQAQIIQGWIIDSFNSELCAKYAVLNNILGASGLSSRLFVNLRDRQGLAYNVRSQYETMLHSAIFNLYIGTAPKNIQKSLFGFKDELEKLANVPPSEDELLGAKENISGRLKYFSQNNSQIAAVKGYNYTMGLGFDYSEKFLEKIFKVEAQDVQNCAKKLLEMPKLSVIIAPEEYRKDIKATKIL